MMNKARELHDLLAREGYRPTLEDGERGATVYFKSQGDRMSFDCMNADPSYVYLRAFYTAENFGRPLILGEVNRLNARFKCVKATLDEDRDVVTFSLEAWYAEVEHFAPHFERWLGLVADAASELFGRLRAAAAASNEGVVK